MSSPVSNRNFDSSNLKMLHQGLVKQKKELEGWREKVIWLSTALNEKDTAWIALHNKILSNIDKTLKSFKKNIPDFESFKKIDFNISPIESIQGKLTKRITEAKNLVLGKPQEGKQYLAPKPERRPTSSRTAGAGAGDDRRIASNTAESERRIASNSGDRKDDPKSPNSPTIGPASDKE